MKKGIVLLTIALSVSLNAKFSKKEQKILNLTKSADISESFVKNRIDYYKRKDKNIYYTCAEYRFMLGKEESEKNFLACLYFNYYAINKKATKIEKLKKLLNNKFQVYKKLVAGMEDNIVKMNNIYNKLEEKCSQLKVNEEYILNIKEDLSWLNKIKSKDKTICKIEKKDGKNILHKLYEYEAKLKESKVANSLKDISSICSKAAFDIKGGTYKAIVQKDFYEKNKDNIKNKIPENEGCVFVNKIEDNNKVNIIYTGLMGDGDSDASDVVLKETKESVQAKQQAEQAKQQADLVWNKVRAKEQQVRAKEQQVRAKEQQVRAKGYYGWLLDVFNNDILPNITKENKVLVGLKKIDKSLKILNLNNHQKKKLSQGFGLLYIQYKNNHEIFNLVKKISNRLGIYEMVKQYQLK